MHKTQLHFSLLYF